MQGIETEVSRICFLILDSIIDQKSAAYVAGPLDTGKAYYHQRIGPTENVRQINQGRLTQFARQLRTRISYPVIDPGVLQVSFWSGSDYSTFFLQVIERYAKEVWFIDGWEFSIGATKEFKYCVSWGLPCFDERGTPLSPENGKTLILQAASYIADSGYDTSKFKSHIP